MVALNELELKQKSGGWLDDGVTRRSFLQATGILAAGTAIGLTFFRENPAKAANFGMVLTTPP